MSANFNNIESTLVAGYGQYFNPLDIYTPGHKTYSVGSGDISGAVQNLEFLSEISGKDIANEIGKDKINSKINNSVSEQIAELLKEKGYTTITATSIKSVSKIDETTQNIFKLKDSESAILIGNNIIHSNNDNILIKTDDQNLLNIQIKSPKNTEIGSRVIRFN